MNLSSTIKSIQDIMRKDDGVDGDAQRIGQLTWMLFLKVFDQREEEWEDDATDKGKEYVSPLPDECRWSRWAKYIDGKPQKPAGELIDFVNNTVFPKLKELNIDGAQQNLTIKKAKVVRAVFRDSNNYMKSGTLMLEVIEKLDEAINIHDFTSRQHLGDIYEKILNDLRSAGNAGEFYTPRAITRFMVQRVNPRLGETVLDPACGTGGFLTATYNWLHDQMGAASGVKDKKTIEQSIKGIEKKQLPHLLCTTNMLLHGIDIPDQIEHWNTLGRGWNDWQEKERVNCVITNPPFGGKEEDTSDSDYLIQTRETADMFIYLIIGRLLKENGRGAIVLPDGFLFGEGVKGKIKEELLEKCNVHTIIRLPNGVFNPYTGIKTNLLFFTKGKPTETIWYYEHPYPPGYKSYSKTKPITLDEFEPEKSWWGDETNDFANRIENEFAWKVDFKSRKLEAKAKAQPHQDKADNLKIEANDAKRQAKFLSDLLSAGKQEKTFVAEIKEHATDLRNTTITGNNQNLIAILEGAAAKTKPSAVIEHLEKEIEALKKTSKKLVNKAKDEQAAHDRIYWPIYNLDEKNPHAPEAKKHDPDQLLKQYKALAKEITKTEEKLKQELAKAFAHHFTEDEA